MNLFSYALSSILCNKGQYNLSVKIRDPGSQLQSLEYWEECLGRLTEPVALLRLLAFAYSGILLHRATVRVSLQVCVCATGPDTQEMLDSHNIKDMLDGTVPFSWTTFSSRVSFIPVFRSYNPPAPFFLSGFLYPFGEDMLHRCLVVFEPCLLL